MSLIRFSPIHEIVGLQKDLDRVYGSPSRNSIYSTGSVPALQVWETDSAYIAKLLLPGADRNQLSIEADLKGLTIKGVVQVNAPEGAALRHSEFSNSDFVRTMKFSIPIDTDAVTADYKDGVLSVTLPKTQVARAVKVQLNSAPTPKNNEGTAPETTV